MSIAATAVNAPSYVQVSPALVEELGGDYRLAFVFALIELRSRIDRRSPGYAQDGRRWWRASIKTLVDQCPGITIRQMRTLVEKLLASGHVVAEKHRRGRLNRWDQSLSYSPVLTDEDPVVEESVDRLPSVANVKQSPPRGGANSHPRPELMTPLSILWEPNEDHVDIARRFGRDLVGRAAEFRGWVTRNERLAANWDAFFATFLRREPFPTQSAPKAAEPEAPEWWCPTDGHRMVVLPGCAPDRPYRACKVCHVEEQSGAKPTNATGDTFVDGMTPVGNDF